MSEQKSNDGDMEANHDAIEFEMNEPEDNGDNEAAELQEAYNTKSKPYDSNPSQPQEQNNAKALTAGEQSSSNGAPKEKGANKQQQASRLTEGTQQANDFEEANNNHGDPSQADDYYDEEEEDDDEEGGPATQLTNNQPAAGKNTGNPKNQAPALQKQESNNLNQASSAMGSGVSSQGAKSAGTPAQQPQKQAKQEESKLIMQAGDPKNSSGAANAAKGGKNDAAQPNANQQKSQKMIELPAPKSMIEKSAAPLAWQMAEVTQFLDSAYKYQQCLSDIHVILMMVSVVEMISFFTNVLFFISKHYDNQLWYLVLYLGHPARAFIGIAMTRILPHSHEYVEKVDGVKGKGNVQLQYSLVGKMLERDCVGLTLEYMMDYKMPARLYTLLTVICAVLDMISALVFLILVGQNEEETLEWKLLNGAQLFYVSFYFYLDLIYIAYVIHFSLKLPSEQRMNTAKALLGFPDELELAYKQPNTGSSKDRRQNQARS